MTDMRQSIDADDLRSYLSDNRLWVESYTTLGLFGEAAAGFEPRRKAPKTYCPIHGGVSGEAFGFLKETNSRPGSDSTGTGYCNTCRGIGGFRLVQAATGWDFPTTLEQLAIASGYMEGITSGEFKPREKTPEQIEKERQLELKKHADDVRNMEMNRRLWEESFPLMNQQAAPMRLYFENRGILAQASMLGDEVRFHPGVYYSHTSRHPCIITRDEEGLHWYWMDKDGVTKPVPEGAMLDPETDVLRKVVSLTDKRAEIAQVYLDACPAGLRETIMQSEPVFHPGVFFIQRFGKVPCILTRIRNHRGTPVNLHQTFITLDGHKAAVPQVKKVRPGINQYPISGGGAQLAFPGPVLGVGEGLETVLSAAFATGMPVWGLLNSSMMASWIPPVGTRRVYIWEDPDKAGNSAATALAQRLADMGIEVIRCSTLDLHPNEELDWNDVLLVDGPEVFPHQDWMSLAA